MSGTFTPLPGDIERAMARAARVRRTVRCCPLAAMSIISRCSLSAGLGPVQSGLPPSHNTWPSRRFGLCSELRLSGSPLGVRTARIRMMFNHSCSRLGFPIVSGWRATSRQKVGAAVPGSIRRNSAKGPGARCCTTLAAARAASAGDSLGCVISFFRNKKFIASVALMERSHECAPCPRFCSGAKYCGARHAWQRCIKDGFCYSL